MNMWEVWDFIQQGAEVGISLEKLAEVRKNDQQGGVSTGTIPGWQLKLVSLYRNQAQKSFKNVNKICVVSDASVQSTKDYIVTLCYSGWQGHEVAACAVSQYLNAAKIVFPGQFNLTDAAERLCATREQERLASYKVMQAWSAQLFQLSGLTLEDFVPAQGEYLDYLLRPFRPGEMRVRAANGQLTIHANDGPPMQLTLFDLDV